MIYAMRPAGSPAQAVEAHAMAGGPQIERWDAFGCRIPLGFALPKGAGFDFLFRFSMVSQVPSRLSRCPYLALRVK